MSGIGAARASKYRAVRALSLAVQSAGAVFVLVVGIVNSQPLLNVLAVTVGFGLLWAICCRWVWNGLVHGRLPFAS